MATVVYVCKDCNSENDIKIFALSSEGFFLSCPSCNRERWFKADEDLKTRIWVWKCRDCKKEYPEHYKFTTTPYRCGCGGMVDLCISLSGYNAPVETNHK